MRSAMPFVSFADSDDDDYVSMSEGEVDDGLQRAAQYIREDYLADSCSEADMSGDDYQADAFGDSGRLTPPLEINSQPRVFSAFTSSAIRRSSLSDSLELLDESAPFSGFERRPSPPIQARGKRKKKAPLRGRKLIAAVDDEEIMEERQRRLSALDQKRNEKGASRRVRQKVNTNIISIDLATLASDASQIATGDPYACKNCKAILSSFEELRTEGEDFKMDEGEYMWVCQFCLERNVIDIEIEEKPEGESQDYMMAPPQAEEAKSADGGLTIFCVDISGSMCVTKEVAGKFKLKGDRTKSFQSLNIDGEDQFFMNQSRNSTWISRLQSVQAAVDHQIENLAKTRPAFQVGLVTFANDVTIVGDGTSEVEIVAGDKLENMAELRQIGTNYRFEKTIAESKADLLDRLWKLEENGATALGPGLVVSIAMAARRPGSQVILCTDGLANIGVGSLDGLATDEEKEAMINWYEEIGNWALELGVVVNMVSISDEDCRLENLGRIAEKTRGDVKRLDPLKLTKQFKGLVDNRLIATQCTATMFLHPGLIFTSSLEQEEDDDEDDSLESNDEPPAPTSAMAVIEESAEEPPAPAVESAPAPPEEPKPEEPQEPQVVTSTRIEEVGNVFADTKAFFEFLVNKEKRGEFAHLEAMPFQVQIEYRRLDGAKMMRVITQTRQVARTKVDVQADVDMNILSEHTTNITARLCRRGSYEASRMFALANSTYMDRNAKTAEQVRVFNKHMKKNVRLDQRMQVAAQEEVQDERMAAAPRSYVRQQRAHRRDDGFSEMMYDNLY